VGERGGVQPTKRERAVRKEREREGGGRYKWFGKEERDIKREKKGDRERGRGTDINGLERKRER
jgi:hypothetical protein